MKTDHPRVPDHVAAAALLERYFATTSTPDEEERLRAYYASGNVAPELVAYAPLFAYWADLRATPAPLAKTPTATPALKAPITAVSAPERPLDARSLKSTSSSVCRLASMSKASTPKS